MSLNDALKARWTQQLELLGVSAEDLSIYAAERADHIAQAAQSNSPELQEIIRTEARNVALRTAKHLDRNTTEFRAAAFEVLGQIARVAISSLIPTPKG